MGFYNKGAEGATATVSRDPDLSGNYVCNGTNDEVEINQAIADLETISPTEVSLLIKPGRYNIYDHINADGCSSKDLTTFANSAYFRLADGRPDTESADWMYHVILLQMDAALTNFKWFGGEFDGNKANQTMVNANKGIAVVYFRHSGNNIVFRDVWAHDHFRRGIMTKCQGGNYYDVHYTYCKGMNNGYDDLKFSIEGSYSFYGSSINNCIAGGDTGDIGIDLFDQNGTGFMYDIQICNNIVFRMTGAEGSSANHYPIRNEDVSERILIANNTILDCDRGISDHVSSPQGRNIIIGNHIHMDGTYTDTRGIQTNNPRSSIIGNYIYGEKQAGEVLIYVQNGSSHALINGNYLNNGTKGIELEDAAVYTSINNNYLYDCTTGIDINGTSDDTSVRGNTFDGTTGLVIAAGALRILVDGNDFSQCTRDVNNASGNWACFGGNKNQAGAWIEGATGDDPLS